MAKVAVTSKVFGRGSFGLFPSGNKQTMTVHTVELDGEPVGRHLTKAAANRAARDLCPAD